MHPASCPACDCPQCAPIVVRAGRETRRCDGCGLHFIAQRPSPTSRWDFAERTTSPSADVPRSCISQLASRAETAHKRLLYVGPANASVTRHFVERGYDVTPVTALGNAGLAEGPFDACVCAGVLGRVGDPVSLLTEIRRVLVVDGVLLVQTPLAPPANLRPLDGGMDEVYADDLQFFDPDTLLNVLARTGFREVDLTRHGSGRQQQITAIGRAAQERRQPLLSIVVPAYNEAGTIRGALDRLIAKPLPGLDKEIIVVESNSTDGTRDAVKEYEGRPGIRLVLTERPNGKGHAVRQGLEHATGDFVIIQDADDEYDIDDYDALLAPLTAFRKAFVLGTRHQGHWRIRSFGERRSITVFMNSGHVLLTEFFNLLYRQSLTDPWTMYKVFRRDCLHGVHLECNRFDFDVELVAKLVRRGFSPLEIPVRYHSRSFAEGKKIRVFRDPLTWLWACVKYRVVSFRATSVRS